MVSVSEWPAKAMAHSLELAPQLRVVVYLAVEDDRVAAAGRMHRLMAKNGEVDNGEAAKPQSDAGRRVGPHTVVVGAAVADRRNHAAGGVPKLSLGPRTAG